MIGISFSDVNYQLIIQSIDGKINILKTKNPPEHMEVNIILSTEIFHKVLAGTLNPMLALRQKLIICSGSAKMIMKFANLIISLVPFYQKFLEEKTL